MTWERVEKLIGADNLKLLAQKRVGIVGLGSGGGFVAQGLAMSGIGHFVLIDDDALEAGNIVRHVADSRDIGKAKVQAMAELIRLRNPEAVIDARVGRIETHLDALDNLDILVVGVDGENVKYIINEACLARGLTAVYAGVYERGEGGDVVVIRPFDGPCYACWSEQLREGIRITLNDQQELDYGMIGENGTLEAEPGLWLHVVKVAAIQADLVLNELLSGTNVSESMPANTIIVANNSLEIIEGQANQPHTSLWVDIPRDPDCLVCGERMRQRYGTMASNTSPISLDDLAADNTMTDIIFEDDNAGRDSAL